MNKERMVVWIIRGTFYFHILIEAVLLVQSALNTLTIDIKWVISRGIENIKQKKIRPRGR